MLESQVHPHVPSERAILFHSDDPQSTEQEYLQLLYSLVYALKPISVLETGTFVGKGSVFLARALRRNGTGRLTTVDNDSNALKYACANLRNEGLADYVDVVESDSTTFLETTDRKFDFALFDSLLEIRAKEIDICLERKLLRPGSMFAIHDTSHHRVSNWNFERDKSGKWLWEYLERMVLENVDISYVEFPYSRGLVLAQIGN